MFVVANWGRLELCGVGRMDAYVMGLSRRMRDACLCESEGKRGRERERGEKMEGVKTHK